MEKLRLSSGYFMPVLGLGTWQAASETVTKAVLFALNAGYRHIDTAYNYKNEESIGDAITMWLKGEGVSDAHMKNNRTRDELFITTKLPHIANRPSDVENYLKQSLKHLKLDYIDLYLVHMPFTFKADNTGSSPAVNEDGSFVLEQTDHLAVWREMERQVEDGRARSIGISNFNEVQLEKLYTSSMVKIKPAVLQVEMHAALQQKRLREYCYKNCIIITAYSPLASPGAKQYFMDRYGYPFESIDLLHSKTVEKLAVIHKRTSAQILLRHLVQLGVSIIPKSANQERILENSKIFDFKLSESEMEEMSSLDCGNKGRVINFLFFKGVEKHPDYPFKDELPKNLT